MKTLTNDDIFDDGLERVSEAASFLGMSRSHVYRLLRDGILPTVKIGNVVANNSIDPLITQRPIAMNVAPSGKLPTWRFPRSRRTASSM